MRQRSRHLLPPSAWLAGAVLLLWPVVRADYTNFESSQVHPIAYDAAAQRLLALNTPAASLDVFDVAPDGGLTPAGVIPVGLEPVSLALDGDRARGSRRRRWPER